MEEYQNQQNSNLASSSRGGALESRLQTPQVIVGASPDLPRGGIFSLHHGADKMGAYGLTFRMGFASIFLINSINAWLQPNDFIKLIENNPIIGLVGHIDLMVSLIAVNDLILGILIMSGRLKKLVYAWSGVWLLIVAAVKLMFLFGRN